MKRALWKTTLLIGLPALVLVAVVSWQAVTQIKGIAAAYLYGYPLLLMEATREAMLARGAGSNRLVHNQVFPDHNFKTVVRPNNDTLYSIAWMDLSDQALVLTVPDTAGRYYVMPLMDAWTNVFAMVGKRTTGTGAGAWLIAGPDWQGSVPDGLGAINAPTNMVWMIGRIQTNGREDIPAVADLQRQFALTPLSRWQAGHLDQGITSTPDRKAGHIDPAQQVAALDAERFLAALARLMGEQYPAAADQQMLTQLAAIGVVPGQPFDRAELGLIGGLVADFAIDLTRRKIRERLAEERDLENGWAVQRDTIGNYGTNYPLRAAVATIGLGALPPAEASYPNTSLDTEQRPLLGEHRYRLRFESGSTPPVDAFWSLTLYDEHGFLVQNPIGRYTIGDRDELQYNDDGSLEILIQHRAPQRGQSNWLPAPAGPFALTLRVYSPREDFLDGSWKLPSVQRLD